MEVVIDFGEGFQKLKVRFKFTHAYLLFKPFGEDFEQGHGAVDFVETEQWNFQL
jgi:hypothetical protein